ncbi:MAG TPA: LptF/LptG family permease [Verrucomicrobiae bacterium]|nr:LptF/LptG family permease [Verrucomicrobiae bacterium]
MKTLHLHLTRQVLAALLMTVAVFTFVLLLGNMLKEILSLLVNQQVTLTVVFKAIGLLIPFVLVHALPLGMLTATLLVFGRFSADQELTAVRASGVSLIALCTPILLLSVAMSAVCGVINLEVAPACRAAYRELFNQSAARLLDAPLPEGRFVQDFPGYVIYAGKVNGTNLEDVLFYQMKDGEKISSLHAERGTIQVDSARRQLQLEFYNCVAYQRVENIKSIAPANGAGATNGTNVVSTNLPGSNAPATNDVAEAAKSTWQSSSFTTYTPDPMDFSRPGEADHEPKITDLSFRQLQAKREALTQIGIQGNTPAESQMRRQVEVQMHRQVAYSFACIGFTLVGIPLGIRVHRRETSVGLAIAIVLVVVYYGLLMFGQSIESRASHGSYLLLWAPNFLFQSVGGFLLWRANRGI